MLMSAGLTARILMMTMFCGITLCRTTCTHGQNLDDDFLNSAVFIHFPVDRMHEKRGSGFILVRDLGGTPDQFQLILITNKHMLPSEHSQTSQIAVRIEIREGNDIETRDISIEILDKDGRYLPTVQLHPDKFVDVAVVNVSHALNLGNSELLHRIVNTHKAVTTALLLAKHDIKDANIGIGSQIYLLGFPAGVYDPRNAAPILRIGVIASEPNKDFSFDPILTAKYGLPSPIPGFLIDANVFPGSSGSMVLRRPNTIPGVIMGGPGAIPYILGIVADSIPIDDIWGTTRMGLGVVFGSETILDTIKLLPKN